MSFHRVTSLRVISSLVARYEYFLPVTWFVSIRIPRRNKMKKLLNYASDETLLKSDSEHDDELIRFPQLTV